MMYVLLALIARAATVQAQMQTGEVFGRVTDLKDTEGKDPEEVARAVFIVLVQRISDGEIEDVKHVLPADIRDLWPCSPWSASVGISTDRSPA